MRRVVRGVVECVCVLFVCLLCVLLFVLFVCVCVWYLYGVVWL